MLTKDVLLTKTLYRTLKILSNSRINLTCFHTTRCSSRWDWTRQIKIKRANKQILAISNPKSSSTPPPPTLISISFNKVNNYKNSRSSKLPSKIWWTTPSSCNTCSSKIKPISRVPLTRNKAQAKSRASKASMAWWANNKISPNLKTWPLIRWWICNNNNKLSNWCRNRRILTSTIRTCNLNKNPPSPLAWFNRFHNRTTTCTRSPNSTRDKPW